MAKLTLDQIAVPLRTFQLELSLEVGSTVALVGPSGAGKSTVLNTIAGLVKPAAGSIRCDEETWFDAERGVFVRPEDRRVGLVFQDYALFPHLTVRQNVEYARRHHADEYLDRFQIRHLQDARPGSLSGGERQRVALARALARDPAILLLDEPLAALDAHTKVDVRAELQQLLAGLEIPTLLVTHDFEDAAALADEVGVIVEGRLRQTGTPADLVAQPADPFVASFTGANLLHGEWCATGVGTTGIRLDDGTLVSTTDDGDGAIVLAVYPWDVTISTTRPDDSAMNVVAGAITAITELGNRARVTVGPLTAEITVDSLRRLGLRPGQQVYASFKATGTRVVASRPTEG
ncbi:MAG TPA: ABC transporter ATP-binding protein [Gaiellaceae bacterium]|jgi:molybdate transport system ATP-binding protein|nr:ABC transporter ATP-binding protein [Gaiellaceae bacterium]